MFSVVGDLSERPKADLIVVPFFQGVRGVESIATPSDLRAEVDLVINSGDFSAKSGATMLLHLSGKNEKRLLLLGLGEEVSCNLETLRCAYAAAMKRCQNKRWAYVSFVLPTLKKCDHVAIVRAISESIESCLYLFEEWKSKKATYYIENIALIGTKEMEVVKKTSNIFSGVNLARHLINRNALDITPQTLGTRAQRLAQAFPSVVNTTLLTKEQIEREKMGLFLAVASGSYSDPALIVIEYQGNAHTKDRTMIVGKGVTFDTGGINLKSTGCVEDMRSDMSGAAATLGTIQAAASIKLNHNIVGIIPATENAIGPRSYKPGDVYRSKQGTTVEISNTDAEGRLILADAISYGQEKFFPSRIIDIATLTGGIVVALGDRRAGLFSNNDQFAESCERAGEITGEYVWRMPLGPGYRSFLESDIADIKNAATDPSRKAVPITAAIFLKEFIPKNIPWIHLDIAGTAFLDKPRDYYTSLATGFGVRLMIELLTSYS